MTLRLLLSEAAFAVARKRADRPGLRGSASSSLACSTCCCTCCCTSCCTSWPASAASAPVLSSTSVSGSQSVSGSKSRSPVCFLALLAAAAPRRCRRSRPRGLATTVSPAGTLLCSASLLCSSARGDAFPMMVQLLIASCDRDTKITSKTQTRRTQVEAPCTCDDHPRSRSTNQLEL